MPDRVSRSLEQKLPAFIGALLLVVITTIAGGAYLQVRRISIGNASARLTAVTAQLRDLFQQSAAQLKTATAGAASSSLQYNGPGKEMIVAAQLRDSSGAILKRTGPWASQVDTTVVNVVQARDSARVGSFRMVQDSIVYPIIVRATASPNYVVYWRKLGGTRRAREQMSRLIGSDADIFIGSPATGIWSDLERRVPAPAADRAHYMIDGQDIAGTPWKVVIQFPMAPVMARVRGFLYVILGISLVALAIGLFGTWYISHAVLRTLETAVRDRTHELADTVTALRDAQESLVRKEKLAMLGQLASGVGHELRNPLGVMSNAVYFLKMVITPLPEKVAEYLAILQQQITLSEKIVNDLLDFARLKAPQRKPASLADITRLQLERLGPSNGVAIESRVVDSVPPVLVDDVQIGQIVLNLLTNAVQAMDGKGRIEMRAHAENGHVQLDVSDTGPGIQPDILSKVFEPLFTTKARGIGLGLAVSRTLARANDGDLTVTSTPGAGATFHLVLPAAKGAVA